MKKFFALSAVAALMTVSAAASANDLGEQTFNSVCFVCHKTGVAGAPVFGNKAAWAPRIKKGLATLEKHALNGFSGNSGTMPAKGGRSDLSDDAVKAAVKYMVDHSK